MSSFFPFQYFARWMIDSFLFPIDPSSSRCVCCSWEMGREKNQREGFQGISPKRIFDNDLNPNVQQTIFHLSLLCNLSLIFTLHLFSHWPLPWVQSKWNEIFCSERTHKSVPRILLCLVGKSFGSLFHWGPLMRKTSCWSGKFSGDGDKAWECEPGARGRQTFESFQLYIFLFFCFFRNSIP